MIRSAVGWLTKSELMYPILRRSLPPPSFRAARTHRCGFHIVMSDREEVTADVTAVTVPAVIAADEATATAAAQDKAAPAARSVFVLLYQ